MLLRAIVLNLENFQDNSIKSRKALTQTRDYMNSNVVISYEYLVFFVCIFYINRLRAG